MQVEMVHGPKVTDAHRRACALLAQEAFRTQRISHHRHSKMPHRGQKVPIRVPSSIKDGYYFLTSREYRSKDERLKVLPPSGLKSGDQSP